LGDFGKNGNKELNYTFLDLIKELDNLNLDLRFRISSIEPNLLSDEIITFISTSKKFVRHFHIPLQSGSDSILRLMRRRYDSKLYKSRIEKINKLMPDACIGVDVIWFSRRK
jgi:threonylcarbamoyladenosine tRNA methylthiotransferase MtaB